MACRLFGANPLSKSLQSDFRLEPKEQNLVKFESIFIHENALENLVWETAVIFSRGRWVKIGVGSIGIQQWSLDCGAKCNF